MPASITSLKSQEIALSTSTLRFSSSNMTFIFISSSLILQQAQVQQNFILTKHFNNNQQ